MSDECDCEQCRDCPKPDPDERAKHAIASAMFGQEWPFGWAFIDETVIERR